MNQRTRAATESLGYLALLSAIFIALNFLGMLVSCRSDWTDNERYSLSDGTKRLVGSLNDQLIITAYFTQNLPPPFNATERDVRDILAEYADASDGKIQVRFVAPETEKEREEAQEAGVQLVQHQAIKDDGVTVVEGFRGLVLEYLDKREVIVALEDTSGLEYALTMKIKKMIGDRTSIGLLTGHEGPSLTEGLSRLRACLPTYDFRELAADGSLTPDEVTALLIVEPQTPLSDTEMRHIDRYVMQGGSLGVFSPTMRVDVSGMAPASNTTTTGINTLLRPWGMTVQDGLVFDARCGQAPLGRNPLGMPVYVPHPPVPIVNFDEAQQEHPVLFRLNSAPFPFVSPLELVGDGPAGAERMVLASSSDESWHVTDASIPLNPRRPNEWSQSGAAGPFPVLVAVSGRLPSAFAAGGAMSGDSATDVQAPAEAVTDVQVLVSGSSFFMRDEVLPQSDQGGECQMTSNLAFALNAIDWLAQDSDLIAVRAKNVEEPAIDVPRDVREAEEDAATAAGSAREAATRELQAKLSGDEQSAQEAASERESAMSEADEAMEKRESALEQWNSKKKAYRFGNMLGVPVLIVVAGLLWWQYRRNLHKRIKL
jgi:ABC-type uncharacterized transport system involved in gliding motility auxiliary subunit